MATDKGGRRHGAEAECMLQGSKKCFSGANCKMGALFSTIGKMQATETSGFSYTRE